MQEDYKGHRIKALARQLLKPLLWQPIPEILTREEDGREGIEFTFSAQPNILQHERKLKVKA